MKKIKIRNQRTTKEILDSILTNKRERIGCDLCKENKSTQKFIGYCKDELWLCGDCFKKLTEKKSKDKFGKDIKVLRRGKAVCSGF